MTKPILLLLLLPLPALAVAIDASSAAVQAYDAGLAVGLVGGAVLSVYWCIGAFRYFREVIGVASPFDTSRDLAPHVRGYVDQASHLEALGQRLAAENEAASMKAEREEIFLTAADHMGDPLPPDPIEEAALAAVNVHQWQTDDLGKFRTHVINVNGVDRSMRIFYEDELNDAREEALFNASRSDGLTNADLIAMKEVRKDQEFS